MCVIRITFAAINACSAMLKILINTFLDDESMRVSSNENLIDILQPRKCRTM